MAKTRKNRCFERWDEHFDIIFAAAWRLSSSGLRLEALKREFGIRPREDKWFAEWMDSRNRHPPMTPAMRRHTAVHEASHAVVSEFLLPGSVARAACFREQRPKPHFGKDGHPHGHTTPYVRGEVEYDERTCLEFFDRDAIEYLSRRIAVSQIAGIVERKFGFASRSGAEGDEAVAKYYIGLAERDAIQRRASELLTQLSDSALVEQHVREVADRLCQDEVVDGAGIRAIVENSALRSRYVARHKAWAK
jgi:hypothetical protein